MGKNIKERKTQYQKKLKKQKLFIKFAAKTDYGAGKMKPLKNRSIEKSTHNSSSVYGNYNCAGLCTDILIMPSNSVVFKFALLFQLYEQQLLFLPSYPFWFNFMNSFSFISSSVC